MTLDEIKTAANNGEIPLPGGWILKRDDKDSIYHMHWFLSSPKDDQGVWVAHFWDGKQAGHADCVAFANSLYNHFAVTS